MTVAGVIVDYEAAEGDMIVNYVMVGAIAVGDVSFAEGSNFAEHGMTMGSEVAEGGVAIVADDAIVGGGMIVAVDSDVAQELSSNPAVAARATQLARWLYATTGITMATTTSWPTPLAWA
jgi:hypothetical protein